MSIQLLPHNEYMLKCVKSKIRQGKHSIFVSEATGLGKSYLFMALVNLFFKDKRVLYIVPKLAIWTNINSYPEFAEVRDCIQMTTYTAFNNEAIIKHYADEFDVVFIDEAHHISSDIQGTNIIKLVDAVVQKNGYVFGMTATPYANGDFVDRYFQCSVYGMNVFDAIVKGIFPKIQYEIGVPAKSMALSNHEFTPDNTKLAVEHVLRKYTDVNNWLVFFSDIKSLKNSKSVIEQLFPDSKIFEVSSDNVNPSSVIKEFNSYTGKSVLLSVSMLLEGVHLRHCDGVLLYRNVTSSNTMLQVIGRVCKAYNNKSPVFIDIPNAITGISNLFNVCNSPNDDYEHVKLDIKLSSQRESVLICSQETTKAFDLLLKLSNVVVHSYRGIQWVTKTQLAEALGLSIYKINTWLSNNPESTVNDLIDLCLGDMDYESYVSNGKVNFTTRMVYKGFVVNCNSASLARQLHKSFKLVDSLSCRITNCEVVDYFLLDTPDKRSYYEDSYIGYYNTRGLKWTNYIDVLRKLGIDDRVFSALLGDDIYVKVSSAFEMFKANGINGVTFGSVEELATILNITSSDINRLLIQNEGLSLCSLISNENICSSETYINEDDKESFNQELKSIANECGIYFSGVDELAEYFNTDFESIKQWTIKHHASLDQFIKFKMHELIK